MTQFDTKQNIKTAIESFQKGSLTDNALALFKTLDYNVERRQPFKQKTFAYFKEYFLNGNGHFREDKALVSHWTYLDLLFQLSKEEVNKQHSLFDTKQVDRTIIETYLFFAIGLKEESYNRSSLSQITRELNKVFPMPVMLLFKHGDTITLSIINRRLHKRDVQKDVLEKVTLIKDISLEKPHRAHIEILFDLSFNELFRIHKFSNFVELHNAWQKTLDTKELNKRFYQELSNWYFWAMDHVAFPDDVEKDAGLRNSTNLIRLITRIIFIWFIKEKGLVSELLFDRRALKSIVKDFLRDKASNNYYKAILQNLFFGTLNQAMDERGFAGEGSFTENRNNFRYSDLFTISEKEILSIFQDIPFLNGGLFDCLDKKNEDGEVLYSDGFSRIAGKQAIVPDFLFFSTEEDYDLNEVYGTRNKRYTVQGLIELLSHYKFTIAENTPIEEEVALDPELLGKVFENLLASYNPETKTTARKQTGSFYTPREIVNYMVDESLKAYLKGVLIKQAFLSEGDSQVGLDLLFEYTEKEHLFNEKETQVLVDALDRCKILDPACGSGAFPMGVLHKMVHILHKLDPNNSQWKQRQLDKVDKVIEEAQGISDSAIRRQVIAGLEHNKQDIKDAFESNELDYGRKLYLIENCLYGVDIQPIAVQITKLRFFISLIIDQKKQPGKENLGIRSLPNLETKFVAANTLIGLGNRGQGLLKSNDIQELENELRSLRHHYFSAKTREEKISAQKNDKSIRQKMAKLLERAVWEHTTAEQFIRFDPYDQNASSPWFEPELMFGITDGFDVIIGNPPYIGQKDNNKIFKTVKDSELGVFHQRRMDYFYFFFHAALNTTKPSAVITFITTNYYLTATYADKLRKDFRSRATLRTLVNFNELKIFESALGQHSIITILDKGYNEDGKVECSFVTQKGFASCDVLQDILHGTNEAVVKSLISNKDIYEGKSLYIRMQVSAGTNSKENSIFEKINAESQPLCSICDLVEGIHTGADKLSEKHIERFNIMMPKGTGIYILSKAEVLELNLNAEENRLIKPWFKNSDIQRWTTSLHSDKYLIYYTSQGEYHSVDNIRNHLKQFKPILINRKTRSGTGIISVNDYDAFVAGKKYISYVMNASAFKRGDYYCVSYPREPRVFEGVKIVVPQRSPKNTFAYNSSSWYASADVYFIINKNADYDLKFLLALLNSELFYYWLYHKGKRKGETLELYIRPLSEIPIKRYPLSKQKPIIELVNRVLEAKNSNKKSDIGDLERIINDHIYDMYGLSPAERSAVQGVVN